LQLPSITHLCHVFFQAEMPKALLWTLKDTLQTQAADVKGWRDEVLNQIEAG
jgi:hypothetical protein